MLSGSHRLRVETGRWSRTPREARLCRCDDAGIQDERHIIESCSLLDELRQSFENVDFTLKAFFEGDNAAIAAYIYHALKIVEN